MKNPIIESFKDSWRLVKKYKHVITLIFFLQLLFFSLLGVNIVTTLTPVIESTQEVLEYVSQLKMDEEALAESLLTDESVFGDDPMVVHRNYTVIMRFLGIFLAVSLLLFFIFEGLAWVLTVYLPQKKKLKVVVNSMANFFVLALAYFLVIAIIAIPLKSVLVESAVSLPLVIFSLILLFLVVYFMLISFSLIYNDSIKIILKKAFLIGVFKAYLILPVILFGIVLMGITSFILYKTVEANLLLLMFSLILFVFSFIFTRLLFVRLIYRIDT